MVAAKGPRKPKGDAAVASGVVAFLIAGVLFMASVVAVLVTTRNSSDEQATGDAPNAVAYRVQADGLSNILLDSPGYVDPLADPATCPSNPDWSDGAQASTGKVTAADCLRRLGLRDAQSSIPRMFDYSKFQNLRNAPFEEDGAAPADGFVNYKEAREALGLDAAGMDFHIRAYPSLQSVKNILACSAALDDCRDPNLQVTYVGNIQPEGEVVETTEPTESQWAALFNLANPKVTCTTDPALPQTYRLATTIRNGGAGTAADGLDLVQLRASFTADFAEGAGPAMTQNANGYLVDQGETIQFIIDAPAYDGRYCKTGSTVRVDLKDHEGVIWSFTQTLGVTENGASAADKDFWIDANDYFLAGDDIRVSYNGNNIKNKVAVIELLECDCTTATDLVINRASHLLTPTADYSKTFTMKQNGGDVEFPDLPAGVYTAVLYDGSTASSAMRVTERIIVVDAEPTEVFIVPSATTEVSEYEPADDATDEVAMLEVLMEKFCPTYWNKDDAIPIDVTAANPTGTYEGHAWSQADWDDRCAFKTAANSPWPGLPTHLGDVFPASEKALREELIERLTSDGTKQGTPIYTYVDVLIIGSGVEHSELSSENIKGPIETWVEGGGTIIVLGSEVGKNNNWLNPFLNSGTRSSGGGVSVPDPAHPILHVPDELDYGNYDNDGEVWEFHGSSDANERFTQVVSQGEDGKFEPILAVSKPGALRDDVTGTSGTVILTTWVAYDVYLDGSTPEAAFNEGLKFLNNLLMMGYGTLYMDYGPSIPDNTNVVPAVRTGQIKHPDFDDPIQITMQVFVFPGVGT